MARKKSDTPSSKGKPNQEAFDKAVRFYGEAKSSHANFVNGVEKRYKSWRGFLDQTSEAASWTSKQHPPYINHIVETSLASMIDDNLNYSIRPRMTLATLHDPAAQKRAQLGADAHNVLYELQTRHTSFTRTQRPFVLQNAIAGLTVAKTYWVTEYQRRRRMIQQEEPLLNEFGDQILHPITAHPLTMPRLVEAEVAPQVTYDGPYTEVVDVRDFMWHEAAVSLDRARYVIHNVWVDPEDIDAGLAGDTPQFGAARGGWSAKDIKDAIGESRDFTDELGRREQELYQTDRTKGLIMISEVWDQVERTVTVIANCAALLAHFDFPFHHEKTPFVVCSTQPDLFRIPGISQVEKVEALQNLLWSLINQRIDNLQLINNAIFMFRPDIEDVNEYEFEPGARWPVEDPTQVNMWSPNVVPAEVSLGAEALLKGDLQNLAGGFPFASGTDSQTVDQKTATGASIVTSLAQRSINLAKTEVYDAWEDVGYQRMVLNQQFIREDQAVPVLGLDGDETTQVVEAALLAGDFSFELEPGPDQVMEQQEQAKAQALIQLAGQLVPVTVMLSQSGAAKALNMDAFVEDLLRSFGKTDVERYFLSQPPAVAPPAPGAPGAPGAPAGPDQGGQGITGPQSIDPSVSPAVQTSEAPSTLMQRLGALTGGGQNVPNG